MKCSLRDRLQRLDPPRRAEVAQQETCTTTDDPLNTLERSLLGAPAPEGSLKERLERLVRAATERSREQHAPAPQKLEALIPGQEIVNERGHFLRVERRQPLDLLHGALPLSRLMSLRRARLSILVGEEDAAQFDAQQAVFLDTETTGLAGGTGTAAFLVGLGYVEQDRFVLRQYFMRDYDEEPAMIAALAEDLGRFSQIVTFNGKMFDVPLLESRFRLNRRRFPLSQAAHVDLLHPARRLWKARLESCRLQHLEAALLGLPRRNDIPGEEIPQAYFDFIRHGDGRRMAQVIEHNRQDILSLAALLAVACDVLEEGRATDPRDILSVARVFERAGHEARAEAEYRRVIEMGTHGELRQAARLRLAADLKRRGQLAAAVELWEATRKEDDLSATRELAMFYEHRQR
ncbi:MAG: tetratricopeptide repeat protein, partial [Vicinamibacteria bacterium]|nr:tetratricopeptide repeat protein [Vicinamibacteria bacterium]